MLRPYMKVRTESALIGSLCPICGAIVHDEVKHTRWHDSIRSFTTAVTRTLSKASEEKKSRSVTGNLWCPSCGSQNTPHVKFSQAHAMDLFHCDDCKQCFYLVDKE
jgi:predicted RNA-binding Zn-ribbon protein involved in translation (DUF1610 family)